MIQKGTTSSSFWWLFVSVSRGLAAFIAVYSFVSLASAFLFDVYNQNSWWISFSFIPEPFSLVIQIAMTAALMFFAFHVPQSIIMRIAVALPVVLCFIAALSNMFDVFSAAAAGTIILNFPLPFSFFVSLGLACIVMSILFGYRAAERKGAKLAATMLATIVLTAVLFPLGQMHCFGTTLYRGPVDAVVVLGAQVYPSGIPSPVLQDRLDTAIRHYEEGHAPVMVLSGGIDIDGTSEARAMQAYVVEHGVPIQNTIIDEHGSNTKQTVKNTADVLRAANLNRVAAVSNFYHLARIKMLYLSEGIDVVTVPSVPMKDPGYPLLNVVREIPAWWYYWCSNLVK